MALLPFCGYNMGEYFQHWLNMQRKIGSPPKIFQVNWFRKGQDGKFLWPGFGENMRVLKGILDRAEGKIGGEETMLGGGPKAGDPDLAALDLEPAAVNQDTTIGIATSTSALPPIDN